SVLLPHPRRPPLFPYTTLFRSRRDAEIANEGLLHLHRLAVRRLVRVHVPTGDDDERRLVLLEAPRRDLASQLPLGCEAPSRQIGDRKSTRLNSSHLVISYAVFC